MVSIKTKDTVQKHKLRMFFKKYHKWFLFLNVKFKFLKKSPGVDIKSEGMVGRLELEGWEGSNSCRNNIENNDHDNISILLASERKTGGRTYIRHANEIRIFIN